MTIRSINIYGYLTNITTNHAEKVVGVLRVECQPLVDQHAARATNVCPRLVGSRSSLCRHVHRHVCGHVCSALGVLLWDKGLRGVEMLQEHFRRE